MTRLWYNPIWALKPLSGTWEIFHSFCLDSQFLIAIFRFGQHWWSWKLSRYLFPTLGKCIFMWNVRPFLGFCKHATIEEETTTGEKNQQWCVNFLHFVANSGADPQHKNYWLSCRIHTFKLIQPPPHNDNDWKKQKSQLRETNSWPELHCKLKSSFLWLHLFDFALNHFWQKNDWITLHTCIYLHLSLNLSQCANVFMRAHVCTEACPSVRAWSLAHNYRLAWNWREKEGMLTFMWTWGSHLDTETNALSPSLTHTHACTHTAKLRPFFWFIDTFLLQLADHLSLQPCVCERERLVSLYIQYMT